MKMPKLALEPLLLTWGTAWHLYELEVTCRKDELNFSSFLLDKVTGLYERCFFFPLVFLPAGAFLG